MYAATKKGYKFKGWYGKNGEAITEILPTDSGEKYLYPKWEEKEITIKFIGNGGTSPDSMTVPQSTTMIDLPISERKYVIKYDAKGGRVDGNPEPKQETVAYKFEGWYTETSGGTLVEQHTRRPEEDITLYAHWTATSVKLKKATREGYTFGGWYEDEGYKIAVQLKDGNYTPDMDRTIYANWDAKMFNIEYHLKH